MKKSVMIFGLILVGVGILVWLVPHMEIPVSSVLVDESFVVPSFGDYALNWSFLEKTSLHIMFEVDENKSITFWVLNEGNYDRKRANESFGYVTEISHPYTSSMDVEWIPPASVPIYFVWDNHFSYSSKEVHTLVTVRYTRGLLPPTTSYLGVLLLPIGVAITYYGLHAHNRNVEEKES